MANQRTATRSNNRISVAHSNSVELTAKGRFYDYTLLILVIVLMAFGLMMVYSAYSYKSSAMSELKSQFVAVILGLIAMIVISLLPQKLIKLSSLVIYPIGLLLVLWVLTGIFVSDANGASRWIEIPGLPSIQPSEILKIGVIMILALWLSYTGKNIHHLPPKLIFFLLLGFAVGFVIFITKNFSAAIIMCGIAYVEHYIMDPKPRWQLIISVGLLIFAMVAVYYFWNYAELGDGNRFNRVIVWGNPEKYSTGMGRQVLQSLYTIGSGGLFGKGIGNSVQKLSALSEAGSDMVFSVICEELGIFGGLCIIILFAMIIWRLTYIAANARDKFDAMLVVGVMTHIALQVLIHIAVCLNFFPNTGVTLPFISEGGTSVCCISVEIGLCLGVSRRIQFKEIVERKKQNLE